MATSRVLSYSPRSQKLEILKQHLIKLNQANILLQDSGVFKHKASKDFKCHPAWWEALQIQRVALAHLSSPAAYGIMPHVPERVISGGP